MPGPDRCSIVYNTILFQLRVLKVLYTSDLGQELDHALLRVIHFLKDCEALMHQILIADILMARLNIVHHLSLVTELENVARVHMET